MATKKTTRNPKTRHPRRNRRTPSRPNPARAYLFSGSNPENIKPSLEEIADNLAGVMLLARLKSLDIPPIAALAIVEKIVELTGGKRPWSSSILEAPAPPLVNAASRTGVKNEASNPSPDPTCPRWVCWNCSNYLGTCVNRPFCPSCEADGCVERV